MDLAVSTKQGKQSAAIFLEDAVSAPRDQRSTLRITGIYNRDIHYMRMTMTNDVLMLLLCVAFW